MVSARYHKYLVKHCFALIEIPHQLWFIATRWTTSYSSLQLYIRSYHTKDHLVHSLGGTLPDKEEISSVQLNPRCQEIMIVKLDPKILYNSFCRLLYFTSSENKWISKWRWSLNSHWVHGCKIWDRLSLQNLKQKWIRSKKPSKKRKSRETRRTGET